MYISFIKLKGIQTKPVQIFFRIKKISIEMMFHLKNGSTLLGNVSFIAF